MLDAVGEASRCSALGHLGLRLRLALGKLALRGARAPSQRIRCIVLLECKGTLSLSSKGSRQADLGEGVLSSGNRLFRASATHWSAFWTNGSAWVKAHFLNHKVGLS